MRAGLAFVSMAAKPNIIDPTSLKSPGFSSLLKLGGTYGRASCGLRGSPDICKAEAKSLFDDEASLERAKRCIRGTPYPERLVRRHPNPQES